MVNRYEFTPDPMQDLQINEVFVFGANKLGKHSGGAANAAYKNFGAQMGEIHRSGSCYGLVTLNEPVKDNEEPNQITLDEFEKEFEIFFKIIELEKDKLFYLTKVGLGIAGWSLLNVRSIFHKFYNPQIHKNLIFPIEFKK